MPDDDLEALGAKLAADIAAYEATLSPLELYRYRRSILVGTARKWRKIKRINPAMAKYLGRGPQINMVRARLEYWTGVKPGGD